MKFAATGTIITVLFSRILKIISYIEYLQVWVVSETQISSWQQEMDIYTISIS